MTDVMCTCGHFDCNHGDGMEPICLFETCHCEKFAPAAGTEGDARPFCDCDCSCHKDGGASCSGTCCDAYSDEAHPERPEPAGETRTPLELLKLLSTWLEDDLRIHYTEPAISELESLKKSHADLMEMLRMSKQLANYGYRIGEADMRSYDKTAERYTKLQNNLEATIDAALAAAKKLTEATR